MRYQITKANVAAFLMSGLIMLIPVIQSHISAGTAYMVTLVAVYAFHLSGQWLQAVQPSIKAQVTETVTTQPVVVTTERKV